MGRLLVGIVIISVVVTAMTGSSYQGGFQAARFTMLAVVVWVLAWVIRKLRRRD